MAETDERLAQADEHMERARGFISDAEFRDEIDTRTVRYLQAIAYSQVALYLQNQVLIEKLGGSQ